MNDFLKKIFIATSFLLVGNLLLAVTEVQEVITATLVPVGDQRYEIPVGTQVTVLSRIGDNASIILEVNGKKIGSVIPVNALRPLTLTPATAVNLPQIVSHESSTKPEVPAPITSKPTSPYVAGWQTVTLKDIPPPPVRADNFPYTFNSEEKLTLYLPETYDPSKPVGVLAWTNADDSLNFPQQFTNLLEEYYLIGLAVEKCGNGAESERRAGILVSIIEGLSKDISLDRDRFIVSGISGGGRLSALACFSHPWFWRGAISWCGGHFHKDYKIKEDPTMISQGINHGKEFVTKKQINQARKNIKFVLITGENDFNFNNSKNILAAMEEDKFDCILIEEQGLGHAVGKADTMKKGLEYVLLTK